VQVVLDMVVVVEGAVLDMVEVMKEVVLDMWRVAVEQAFGCHQLVQLCQ